MTISNLDPIELFYQELNCFKDYQNEYLDTYFSFVLMTAVFGLQ